MAASINDKLHKYKSLFSTTLSVGIGTGTGDTLTPATVTGLPTDTAITLTIDRVDSAGASLGTQRERIDGVISGGNLTAYVRGRDSTTEQAHAGGAVIEMVWNAYDWNNLVDWALVSHTQAGYLSASSITASMLSASSVTSGRLSASSVVAGNLAASSVLAGNHAASSVLANNITASAVLANNLAASSVLAGNLAASSVLLGNLAASSVSAGNLNFAVSAPTLIGAKVYLSADASDIGTSAYKILYNTEEYDTASAFASNKFTVPASKGGYYYCQNTAHIFGTITDSAQYRTMIYKNGVEIQEQILSASGTNVGLSPTCSTIVHLDPTDYIEFYAQSASANADIYSNSGAATHTWAIVQQLTQD